MNVNGSGMSNGIFPSRRSSQGNSILRALRGSATPPSSRRWSPATTVTNLAGTLEFTDPDAANQAWRFYRTVLR
jgi:hypothetical protein